MEDRITMAIKIYEFEVEVHRENKKYRVRLKLDAYGDDISDPYIIEYLDDENKFVHVSDDLDQKVFDEVLDKAYSLANEYIRENEYESNHL